MTIAQRVLDSAALTAESDPRLAVDLLAEAAFAAIEAGPFGEASLAVARMAALAERSDDTARFRADCSAGYLGWRRGDPDHGARLIRRAVARLEADPLLASRPELQLDSAWAWANIGDHDRARACCGRAVELARSQGAAGRLPDALVLAACMDRDAGRWPSALAHGSRELDLALATGQLTVACEALITAGEIEAAKGRDEGCLRHARQADLLTAELGLRTLHFLGRRSRALLALGRGQLEEAITRYEEMRRLAGGWGYSDAYTLPVPDLIEAYARAGSMEHARVLLPEYLALVAGNVSPHFAALAARSRAIVSAGDFDPISWRRLSCTSAARRRLSCRPARTCATESGCAVPGGGVTRASSCAPRRRSSIGSTPAPGPNARAPNSAPAANP
jgi:tetratricopeptide (TPR) repeat protein